MPEQTDSFDCLPASHLLAGHDTSTIEKALGLGSGEIDWDDAVSRARLTRAEEGSKRIMARLSELRPYADISLHELLRALQEGSGPELVVPYLRGDIRSHQRREVVQWAISSLLEDAVLHLLAEQGLVQVRAGWDGEPVAVSMHLPDGSRHDWPRSAFHEAAVPDDPRAVANGVALLRTLLTRAGADFGRVRPITSEGPVASIPVAALTVMIPSPRFPEQRRDQAYDLVAFDDGLLLAFVPGRERGLAAAFRKMFGASNARQLERVASLVETIDGQPADYAMKAGKSARWIPYQTVDHAYWRERRTSMKWRLELRNTSTVDFTNTAFSAAVGNIQDTVANALY